MLDPDQVVALAIARDISGREMPGHRSLQVVVDEDAVLHVHSGCRGKCRAWRHPCADDEEVRRHATSVTERQCLAIERVHGCLQMEDHAAVPMQAGDEFAEFATEHSLHRNRLGRYHVHVQATCAQSGRSLHADETGADERDGLRTRTGGNDRARIGQRP
jgi:hypothetical protein